MNYEERLNYIGWQTRLQQRSLFRRWWQFWSNYAFIFFAAAAIGLSKQPHSFTILILSVIAFVVARVIVVTLINMAYHRPRPYQKYQFKPITSSFFSLRTSKPTSFPSRHVTAFAAVAGVVMMFNPLVGAVLLCVTLMAGLGRIVLGYHYPTDILGGLLLGALIGIFTAYVGAIFPFT